MGPVMVRKSIGLYKLGRDLLESHPGQKTWLVVGIDTFFSDTE